VIPGDRVRDRTNPWARWSSVYGIVTAVDPAPLPTHVRLTVTSWGLDSGEVLEVDRWVRSGWTPVVVIEGADVFLPSGEWEPAVTPAERVHVDWWLPGMNEPFATGIHTPQRLEAIA
jgi:hypothetical protein